jgi:hypothetical protein
MLKRRKFWVIKVTPEKGKHYILTHVSSDVSPGFYWTKYEAEQCLKDAIHKPYDFELSDTDILEVIKIEIN